MAAIGERKVVSALLSVLLAFSGCSGAEKKMQSPSRAFNDKEMDEGRQIHDSILASFYTYTDPKVTDYVAGVGSGLLRDTDRGDSYSFTILYNDKIYAASAPGGYVYLTTGLLNFLESEAELAAVIAYELGTLQFQDPRVSSGRQVMDKVTQGVAMASPAFGSFGALAVLGAVLVNGMVEKSGVDNTEKLFKSDELALRYMVNAGYDPQGYVDVLRKVVEADKALLPFLYDYYQSHPITEERFSRLNAAFSSLPMEGKSLVIRRDEFMAATKGVREIYRR